MPVVSSEKLIGLQQNPQGIRNICILAHVDHGKTSLTDGLIATNGIISPKMAGKVRYLDARPDEQLRGITMESSAISLCFSMLRRAQVDASPTQEDYLINLIDSPGHIDFSSEVSTASRLCDGALVLVDAVEGVCSQTVTVLRQTWTEHLKPILVINKMDRLITELKMTPAEAYAHLSKLLEQVNAVVGSFFQGERMTEDLMWREKVEARLVAAAAKEQARTERKEASSTDGSIPDDPASISADTTAGVFEEKDDEDIYFAPERGNVIFSSAIDGWAFTVKQFAAIYEKKLGMKGKALEKVLWGDFFLDPKTKRVLGQKHLKGRPLKPMFVQLVLENIWAVYAATTGSHSGKGCIQLLSSFSMTVQSVVVADAYDYFYSDLSLIEKITSSLSIKLPPHVLRSKDPRAILLSLFSAWLPLSTAVLVTVIEQLPSPPAAQTSRLPALIDASPGATDVDQRIRNAMVRSEVGKDEPVVAFVSKMVAVPQSELPESKRRAGALTAEEAVEIGRERRGEIARARSLANRGESIDSPEGLADSLGQTTDDENGDYGDPSVTDERSEDPEHLIGFARLFSGTLNVGDEVYVLPPKFSPAHPHASQLSKVTVTALYLLMGRGLEPLTSVPAGMVFGVAGLEGHILKSGTLCSQVEGGINLAGVNMGSQPIVRVALEPVNPSDLDRLISGMRMLEQSDPCAEYEVLESGEHVISTAGELHLERCLKDLRERFARCEIQASEPIIPYRETIVSAAEMAPPREKDLPRGTVVGVSASKQITIRLRVRPLPAEVTDFLSKHSSTIRKFYSEKQSREKANQHESEGQDESTEGNDSDQAESGEKSLLSLADFKAQFREALAEAKADPEVWADVLNNVAAFGPRRVGPNLLVDMTRSGCCQKLLQSASGSTLSADNRDEAGAALSARDFSDKISYAFQLATAQGPLCNEPIQGTAVFLEDVLIASPVDEETSARERLGRLTGEVIRTVRESIRLGFLDWSARLMFAMYSCEIQASTEVLGRVYGVLTRRRGRILSESLNEGTPFFTIVSLLPVAESFGFSDEIRKRTSGAASPQLIFQGFEMLDQDPFWVPFTEDDLEDLGELADKENVAKKYMDGVRMRKGLPVKGRKLVKDAEKQKTLKR